MPTIADLVASLDKLFPLSLAAEWDNVGLLLGDPAQSVQRIMTCLTVTPESAEEAVARSADLIISHHPILFRGAKRLTASGSEGALLLPLARNNVGVYSPHTALDNASGGINDLLCSFLDLREVVGLRRIARPSGRIKLVAFVPDGDLARVSDALFQAGAGQIGEYRECSFRLAGTGTFHGSDSSNPTVGSRGRREEVAEWRLEVVCPASRLREIVSALRQAHSYEEPAFDLYPLESVPQGPGEGRIGVLGEPVKLQTLAETLRQKLACGPIQVVGSLSRAIRRVAIVCGAGGEFLRDAIQEKADLLITGEMRFHEYLAAQAAGLALVLPGHYATERCGVEHLASRLQTQFPGMEIWPSHREKDPVSWC